MSEAKFWAFHNQVMELFYGAEKHERALELVEREYRNFPEQSGEIAYSRARMYSVVGKQAEALRIFHEALNAGDWFAPEWLENDPGLAELKSLPEFQEICEVCCQHLKLAQANSHSELFFAQPTKQVGLQPLLIALHGNPGNGRSTLEEWGTVTAQGWLLAAPQSSQVSGQNAYSWINQESTTSEICEHLATLEREHLIDPQCVVLGGFSAGGGLAIWMALHQPIKICGFIVLAPYLIEVELVTLTALLETQKPVGLRGYILVGDADPDYLEAARKITAMLNEHDVPCLLEVHSGIDHYYPEDFAAYVRKGLAFIEAD